MNPHGQTTKPRLLLLSTGGTLSMNMTGDGSLAPDEALKADVLQWVPEIRQLVDVDVEIVAHVDSSLIEPALWLKLAERIADVQLEDRYQAVLVLHGTDTLAYTASALSFLLQDLSIPIVLTGSQRPLSVLRTDAHNNILGAVETALEGPLEVMVFFNNRAFRGNRVSKTAIADFDGFDSPNHPPLGRAGIYWEWSRDLFWPKSQRPRIDPDIPKSMPNSPWVIPWVPGLDLLPLAAILKQSWALVFEAFGTGNMPFPEAQADLLERFLGNGGIILVRSQVPKGMVSLPTYEPGQKMAKMGILGSGDMTREALITKLMVLKAQGHKVNKIKHLMTRSLVGELTE